jgi:dTDP-4-dehydrorhamnose reductase
LLRPRFIIGSSGQVAQAIIHDLRRRGIPFWTTTSKKENVAKDRRYLNLTEPASIKQAFADFERLFPGKDVEVYLPGALTHVDRCEEEKELCRQINTNGAVAVAEECATRGYRLCFFSSEYVFGGAEYEGGPVGPFRETDEPFPTSVYGDSKLQAEKKLLAISPSFQPLIIRTTMVFSWAPEGLNFFMQLYRHLEQCKKGRPEKTFKIPVDQISSPTYAPALANAAFDLMEKNEHGVFHVVGKDTLSRRDFLERIVREFGFPETVLEQGFEFLATAALGQKAKRPLTAGLRTDRLEKCGIRVWTLADAFQDIKSQIAKIG